MSSATLRLRKILNDPSCLDLNREWVALDDTEQPPIFVYSEPLANVILKSESFSMYNIYAYWKVLHKASPIEFPALENLFEVAPLFLHGEAHRAARKKLVPPYRRIEGALDQWLSSFTEKFFQPFNSEQPVKPTTLAASYIEGVFRELLAREVGCPVQDLPPLPLELFYFLPHRNHMLDYDSKLKTLVDAMKINLAASGKDPEDAWALASIAVAGQQPLTSALIYGLINAPANGSRWDSETLMRSSAPVSLLGRVALEDVMFGELKITKGQTLSICPSLVHMREDYHAAEDAAPRSLAFGNGAHTCSGRRISLTITDTFFNKWENMKEVQLDTTDIRLVRDYILMPQEKK